MEFFDDYEPTEEELKEIEEMLDQDIQDIEEEKENMMYPISENRCYYIYEEFDQFIAWLKKNGIRW